MNHSGKFTNIIDDELRILAARIKEKIPEESLTSLILLTGLVGLDLSLDELQKNIDLKNLKDLKMFDSYTDLIYTCFYKKIEKVKESGIRHYGSKFFEIHNHYSRQINFWSGVYFTFKPLAELAIYKTTTSAIEDITLGISLFTTATAMYLKNSDDKGLKERKKNLENNLTPVPIMS